MKLLHVLRIIRVIIDGCHGTQLIKTKSKHTLRIEIGKAKRTDHLLHSMRLTIILHCLEECTTNLNIIDEIDPSETYALGLPLLVGTMVDDSSYTSCQFTFLICQEVFRLTEIECRILVFTQRIHIIAEQVGHIIFVARIQIVMKFDESLQVFLCLNLFYLYCHNSILDHELTCKNKK